VPVFPAVLQARQRLAPRVVAPASGYRTSRSGLSKRKNNMNLSLSIGPLVSLIAGILILLVPRLLNYIVAIYLIVIGVIGLFGVR
jgi:hypothetical protein